ncbi:MAG: xanthine dehydrogenase family protein subunit M [Desulfatiglandaceae bacterium]
MIDYEYKKPKSLGEVFTLMKTYGADSRIIAGGTDLMVAMRRALKSPAVLISLRGIDELRYIRKDDAYHIGALTTHRMLECSSLVRDELTALQEGAAKVGSVQIRNVATVGGNICNAAPSADTAGPLLALGAVVVLRGQGGERRIPLGEFFKGPGKTVRQRDEVLIELEIPLEMGGYGSTYWKHSRREAMNLPLVGIAAAAHLTAEGLIDDVRIALTVAAPTPVRALKAEEFLRGKAPEKEVLAEAGKIASSPDCCSPRDSLRCDAWYREEVIRVYVVRMLSLAVERAKNGRSSK